MYKLFDSADIIPISYNHKVSISISQDSMSSNFVHLFTGIRSLGNIKFYDVDAPASFGLTLTRELKYLFAFNKSAIPGSSTTAERVTGTFMSDPDQTHNSSTNNNSIIGHQSIFNYIHGYVYRDVTDFVNSTSALYSTSNNSTISVARLITIRNELAGDTIEPNSIRMEINLSNTSATGVISNTSATGLVTALDIKNPFASNQTKSFFVVPWNISTATASIDTTSAAMTIEAIFRPYNSNSVLLWRRLSTSGSNLTKNSFIKLELVKSADNNKDAFRLYIRSTTASNEFSETFAKYNVQASGLFVPSDVGINLHDGKFHHIIVTWGISGVDGSTTIESGAGSVFGYIDGYKLLNKEQTEPRLGGSDASNGPVIQNNMFEQRYPIRVSPITNSFSGNNLYIGMSNYNKSDGDQSGDIGTPAVSTDANVAGGFDGQIHHIRMWNTRFNDGTTGVKHNANTLIQQTSTAGISFNNFKNSSLTGNANISANLVGWWEFNERNTITANDVSRFSNTGYIVGNCKIDLYDSPDFTVTTNPDSLNDANLSATYRTFLYVDAPENDIIKNKLSNQGRIIRKSADGQIIRVGTIFYDSKLIVLDNDDANAQLNFLYPASGTTGDFGFSVTGNNNTSINIERFKFISSTNRGRLILKAIANGDEYNYTQNNSGFNHETNETVLDDPASYITSVGLFNDMGDMVAIAKLSVPIRKDDSRQVIISPKLDIG